MKKSLFRRSPLSQAVLSWRLRLVPITFLSATALLSAQPAAAVLMDWNTVSSNTNGTWPQVISGNGTVVGVVDDASGSKVFAWSATQGLSERGDFIDTAVINGASRDASFLTGNAILPGETDQRAFRWDASTGFTDLGTLGGDSSSGAGISSNGAVVVGWADLASGDLRAFRWEGGTMQDLGTLDGTGFSWANGVSGDGLVVVGYSNSKAFRWDATLGMVELASSGYLDTVAKAANRDGSVIIGDASTDDGTQAVRWTGTRVQELGTFGGINSSANGVNDDGSVVVGWADKANGHWRAFRWTETGGLVSLGVLSGQTDSEAFGVSDDGNTILGTSGDRFFIWTRGDVLQDLGNLQASVVQSADAVNHLISTHKRRLRDTAQQQCLPGALQTICLSAGAMGYRGESDMKDYQRNAEFSAGLRLNEQYSIGANIAAGRADIREQSAEQRKAFALGLWAAYQQNADQLGWGASVSASGGQSNNSLERGTGLLDVQRARAEMDMSGAALRIAANYGMQLGKSLVTPELALSHVRTRQDGFTERNVAFPLTIGATDSQESFATLGVNLATPVSPKGTLQVSVAVDALLHEDTLAIEGRSAVPGFSHFQLDSSLNKRRLLPSASAGYSHALTANSSIGGSVQVGSSVYKGQQAVSGAGVQYRYAF